MLGYLGAANSVIKINHSGAVVWFGGMESGKNATIICNNQSEIISRGFMVPTIPGLYENVTNAYTNINNSVNSWAVAPNTSSIIDNYTINTGKNNQYPINCRLYKCDNRAVCSIKQAAKRAYTKSWERNSSYCD